MNLAITWDVTPEIIDGWKTPNLYGLLFVTGLIFAFLVVKRMYKREGMSEDTLDKLVIYMVLATIIGARLGHVFFYGPYFDHIDIQGIAQRGYFSHPLDIFKVWEGGLASHGGVLAILIAAYFYSKRVVKKPIVWTLDKLAAPGAIVMAKIIYPQTEDIVTDISISNDKIGSNLLSAISIGTGEGIKMAVNVAAMLLVFIALIAMLSSIFSGIGDFIGLNSWIAANTVYDSFSIEFLLGYLFAPLMWIIGVATEDIALMGQLLGVKLVASEFVGYTQLVSLKDGMSTTHFTYQKSVIMATYMLCGFANFASIGIQIGGIGIIAPKTKKLLTELGFKAMVGGSLVSLMSATIAGIILG